MTNPEDVLELGIFAKTFGGSCVDEVFDAVAGHGLTVTQWNWACVPGLPSLPEAIPVEVTRAVLRASMRSGVRISAISATFNLIQPSIREMGLSRLPALAKAAVALGCDLLTLCTGTRHATDMWAWHPDNHLPDAWADMVDGLRQASRIARCYGVGVAIEPETANVVCDAERAELALRELGDDAQAVSIVLDGANLYRPPADPRWDSEIIGDAAARLGAHIRVAHAKDIANPDVSPSGNAAAHYTHVAAGTGILPYSYYLNKLSQTPAARAAARRGLRLPLILHGLTEKQVPQSVKFMRDAMRSISGSSRCADAVL